VISKEDFNKVWKNSTRKAILNQYYYDDIELRKVYSIIKEVREYITSYESIETIQQCEHSENNKGLDRDTMIEMTNRYLKVHDKLLEILDKVGSDKAWVMK